MTAGQMRTQIMIEDRTLNELSGPTANGYDLETWTNIDGGDHWRYCQWQDAYGSESLMADQAGIEQLATVRCRYSPKITATCRVFKRSEVVAALAAGADPRPYDVFGVHALDDKKHWIEFKVQRRAASL